MVGLVLVSHCRALADAAARLARQVSSAVTAPVASAGGAGDDHGELGTDAVDIMEAVESVYSDDGVLILMDIGSAILSAKTALELMDPEKAAHVSLCSAPLVEGAVSAAVQIAAGNDFEAVKAEAYAALVPKQLDLGDASPAASPSPEAADEGDWLSFTFVARLKNGLHARPASLLVSTAASFSAAVVKAKNISRNKGPESARSINKLALLGILLGDEVEVRASGDDAEAALAAVKKLAEDNFGEPPAPLKTAALIGDRLLTLAPGMAMGRLCRADSVTCPRQTIDDNDPEAEIRRFEAALAEVKAELETHEARLAKEGHADEAGIFNAQKLILMDEDMINEVKAAVHTEKLTAAYLYQQKMNALAADYRNLPGAYLPQRAADINDTASRVLAILAGDDGGGSNGSGGNKNAPEDWGDIILAAKEVQPSMIVRFENRIRGVLSETGSAVSHAAILAKTLGIPGISGYHVDEHAANGTVIIMDGKHCSVTVNPDEKTQAAFKAKIAGWEEQKKRDLEDSKKDAVTRDGLKVYIRANIGEKRDAKMAADYHAEGIGLLRTEFLFLSRAEAPDEDTQTAILREILAYFPHDPVTIRTLDIGGDKPLPWLNQPEEANPFLGVRGVRLCQRETRLFMSHLRAILRAGQGYPIKIMIPMVSTVEEVLFCREAQETAHAALMREGIAHAWPVPLGIMVETPSAAVMADKLAAVADFFSIGSNDLTQYTMAAERGNSALACLAASPQTAVLRMINTAALAARHAGIPISVCGEMAGDPLLSQALAGMGITELSMNPASIGPVKRAITGTTAKAAEETARRCLDCGTLDEVMTVLKTAHGQGSNRYAV
ncbi:MAG: phosphoenolpyruvate--protein phosphotransferase [Spirochaetaceae bacterium]|jgi:phosphocarrier protein FPr|nr:phosphoenolpyruvate--protein phosphotransferase [Spirochaetaceae bacterium]